MKITKLLLCAGFILFIGVIWFLYQDVESITISENEIPTELQQLIKQRDKDQPFIIYTEGAYTYIFYRYEEDGYITTDINIKKGMGTYIITGLINYAHNDQYVSNHKVIRTKIIPEDKIILREKDKR